MNYQGLKTMIESLIQSYRCPDCSSKVTESNIDIIGAAGMNVNIDVECPKCHKHSMVKSHIIQMNMADLGDLKNNLTKNISKFKRSFSSTKIKDSEITNLSKDLNSEKINVSDLFKENLKN